MINLVNETNPILKKSTKEFNFATYNYDVTKTLIKEMFDLMENSHGIGLAAPQVGFDTRLFIMFIDNEKFVCFNPYIVKMSSDEDIKDEGCLSFPHLFLKVKRPSTIDVTYQDLDGKLVERSFSGLHARCFQHELDHLDGITFDTRVSKLVLSMGSKKRSKFKNIRSIK